MTTQAMEYGIRITADGRAAAGEAEKVKQSYAGLGNAAQQAAAAAGRAHHNMEQSAKQTAFAMRQLPMQMTDIATGLASGQSPFMVLMQQGGQLKDVFGGIGPAARAVGGHILGLINPFTLAAGAATVLGAAYYQGSREQDAFRQALILTGNASGTTAERLAALSGSVAGAAGATKGAAADALAQLTATGKVGEAQLGRLAAAALAMQRSTGRAVEDTVKQFAELGKGPVEASLKLNEQYNYLTAAVYRQIKALEDQGRADEAAALAQETYAKAMLERGGKIEGNLGYIERAWNGVKDAAKGAWDTMRDVGRRGQDDSIETLDARLTEMRSRLANITKPMVLKYDPYGPRAAGELRQAIAVAERDLAVRTQIQAEQAQLAYVQAERNKAERAGIDLAREKDKYLSREVQKKNEIARIEQLYAASAKSAADAEARRQALAGVKEKYKPAKTDLDRMLETGRKNELEAYYETGGEETMRLVADKREREAALAAFKEQADDWERFRKEMAGAISVEEKHTESLGKENKRLTEHIDTLGMSATQIADYRASKLEASAASEELAARSLDDAAALLEEQKALPEVAAGYRSLAEAKRAAAGKTAEQAGLTRTAAGRAEAVETWTDIERAAHDAFMHIGEKGRNTWERLNDSLKATLLETLYKLTVKKWIVQIEQSVSGSGSGSSGGFGGLLDLLFNRSSGGAGSMLSGGSVQGNADYIWDLHAGGIAGAGGSALRLRDPAMFAGARRLHGGGVSGLAHDEEPVVLRKGEGVFTPEQMRALGPGGSAITVNVINNGAPVKVLDQRESVDSRGNRSLDVMIGEAAAGELARPGSAPHGVMRSQWGMTPALVGR